MRRRIPSTAVLTTFEACARHQSFTRAAQELALTQSAVCRQIAGLEDSLGVALFRRTRRGVQLTAAGSAYGRKVAERLAALERDTLELMASEGEGSVIELAVVPTFATRWLLPRLPGFLAAHPQAQVHLHTRTRPFLFDGTGLHAALYAGDGHWAGCETRQVMPEHLIPVCSPGLLSRYSSGRRRFSLAQLGHLPLLQQTTRPYAWRRWFAAAGVQVEGDLKGPRYELFSMLAQAAMQGMGVALIPDFMVEEELAQGRLVRPVPDVHGSDRAYYLAIPDDPPASSAVRAFSDWLLSQAEGLRAGGAAPVD